MALDVALDVRIPAALDERLGRLAATYGKSKSRLVREALAEFVVREEAFAASIAEGLAAVDAGDLIDHEQVMREVEEMLSNKK
jgi:predicted transcriptional regulator